MLFKIKTNNRSFISPRHEPLHHHHLAPRGLVVLGVGAEGLGKVWERGIKSFV